MDDHQLNQEYIDFCNYIQPIVSGCAGFARSNGYMMHIPGVIVIMSADEMNCIIINIPIVYNIYITSVINPFLSLKTPEEKSDLTKRIYFSGYNVKSSHLMNYYNHYRNVDNMQCIFYEPDCYKIEGFEAVSSDIKISNVLVSDGQYVYKVPASKSITPLSKADTASLKIYNPCYPYNPNIRVVKYTVFKKKFKLNVDIFYNILVL